MAASVPTTTPLNVTVPNGFTWIVRSIYIATNASGNTGANLSIPGAAYLARVTAVSTANGFSLECRQVLNSGETLQASTTGALAYFLVSGYQLSNNPG